MARRTIIVGVNQCTMAALSMATIAVLVNGPGLGKPVQAALQNLDVGTAGVAGLAIVLPRSCSTAPRPPPASGSTGRPAAAG